MKNNSRRQKDDIPKWAWRLFRAKEQRRQELARLPFEKKIQILLELQKIASAVLFQTRRVKQKPWRVPGLTL